MPDILDEPLVAVAGAVSLGRAATVYMHRGYARPLIDTAGLAARLLDGPDGWYHNDLSNPYFSWPVYAMVGSLTRV